MDNCLLSELERTFKKCSDCLLHPDYIANLNKLYHRYNYISTITDCNLTITPQINDYGCNLTITCLLTI